jgi:DNA polymerase elongation subunit (family B)
MASEKVDGVGTAQAALKKAMDFLRSSLQQMVNGQCGMDKLVITKALRSDYKNPKAIAHKVLADRMGKRDAGNKPSVGDRIAYIYIENTDRKALQGERIETPDYILANPLTVKINYAHYITNQIMKPVQQLFALVLELMTEFKVKKGRTGNRLPLWEKQLAALRKSYPDPAQYRKKEEALRNNEVKELLFDFYLKQTENVKTGNTDISGFFKQPRLN